MIIKDMKPITHNRAIELIDCELNSLVKFYAYDIVTTISTLCVNYEYYLIIEKKENRIMYKYPITNGTYSKLKPHVNQLMRLATFINRKNILRDNEF